MNTNEEVNTVDTIDYRDKYLRALADFDNMRRIMEGKNRKARKDAIAKIISNIISPIYNDLFRGVQIGVEGCEFILRNLKSLLIKNNILVKDDLKGMEFDDNLMEAVASVLSDDNHNNIVLDVVEPGFVDEETGKTIVYAKVRVCK